MAHTSASLQTQLLRTGRHSSRADSSIFMAVYTRIKPFIKRSCTSLRKRIKAAPVVTRKSNHWGSFSSGISDLQPSTAWVYGVLHELFYRARSSALLSRGNIHPVISSIASVLRLPNCIHPRKELDGIKTNIDNEFSRWEESVDFGEVFRLVTWLQTAVNGFHLDNMAPRRGDRELRELDPLVVIASDRAEKMGLC